VTTKVYLDAVQVLTKGYLNTLQVLTKGCLDTMQMIAQGCIVQLIISNNLAVTASVVSVFQEDICWKAQKTPYFGAAVSKYAK
jgi:hypothetical protein